MRVVTEDGRILEIPDGANQKEIDSIVDDYYQTKVGGDPTEPMDRLGAIGAGVEDKLMDFKEGAQQAYYGTMHPFQGEPLLDELEQERLARESEYAPIAEEYPLETTVGQMVPAAATAVIPGGIAAQAGLSAAYEGLQYGEETDPLEAAGYGALGALAGSMAPRVFKLITGAAEGMGQRGMRMMQRMSGNAPKGGFRGGMAPDLPTADKRLLTRADELDLFTFPSMRKGSKPLAQLEGSAKSSPFLSGMTEDQIRHNQKTLDTLALRKIGETGDEFTDDTFGNAADRIGEVYENASRGKDIPVQMDDLNALRPDISQEGEMLLDNYIAKYPELETGVISGYEFNRLRNRISKDIRLHLKRPDGDPESISKIQDVLDEGLKMVAPESLPEIRQAGQQWKNLKALEATGSLSPEYHVNPRAVGNRLRTFDKGGFMRGKNKDDYYDALRIGRRYADMFKVDPAQTSQTATHQWLMRAASDPGSVGSGLLMRPIYQNYLESGGDLGYARMLGAVPSWAADTTTQAGGATARSINDTEFTDMFE